MAGNVDDHCDEGDIDLYDDLLLEQDGYLRENEIQKDKLLETLKRETSNKSSRILELETEIATVKKENGILRRNISCLYKTAKAEIDRKDARLRDLQRSYDGIVFRRTKDASRFLGKIGHETSAMKSDVAMAASSQSFLPVAICKEKRLDIPNDTMDAPNEKVKRLEEGCLQSQSPSLPRISSANKHKDQILTTSSFVPNKKDEERILRYTSTTMQKMKSTKMLSTSHQIPINVDNRHAADDIKMHSNVRHHKQGRSNGERRGNTQCHRPEINTVNSRSARYKTDNKDRFRMKTNVSDRSHDRTRK